MVFETYFCIDLQLQTFNTGPELDKSTSFPPTYINAWLSAEFLTFGITEVVVWIEGGVQCRNQVEECFGWNRVTQIALALHRPKTLTVSTKHNHYT